MSLPMRKVYQFCLNMTLKQYQHYLLKIVFVACPRFFLPPPKKVLLPFSQKINILVKLAIKNKFSESMTHFHSKNVTHFFPFSNFPTSQGQPSGEEMEGA